MSAFFNAADADGDGIADSVYWAMPGGTINGVTYFAAVRVVDLGSTINVNTAWAQGQDFAFGATLPAPAGNYSYLPAHIGLVGRLNAADSQSLATYRFGQVQSLPTGDEYAFNTGSNSVALVAGATYFSQGDALYEGLSRRLDNPGYVNTTDTMAAFPLNDTGVLASRFVINSQLSSGSPLLGTRACECQSDEQGNPVSSIGFCDLECLRQR